MGVQKLREELHDYIDRADEMFLKMVLLISALIAFSSCQRDDVAVNYDFNHISNRIWAGEDFWTVPLEDWKISNGRVEYIGKGQQATLSVLPYVLKPGDGTFKIRLSMGILAKGDNEGAVGLKIGSVAKEDPDIRAAIFYGDGIKLGISTEGYAFVEQNTRHLPSDFDFSEFMVEVSGFRDSEGYAVSLKVLKKNGTPVTEIGYRPERPLTGIVQIVNNFRNSKSKDNGPQFWYDNFKLEGSKLEYIPDHRFGPILWAMHTLSRKTLKISVQLPPLGAGDNQVVGLSFKKGGNWVNTDSADMDSDSRNVTFRVDKWDATADHEYMVTFNYRDVFGNDKTAEYEGTIRLDPVDRPLIMGALTCQEGMGYPYGPVIKNLALRKPDILYFSGDQIYENNGGYPIKREPAEMAILSYLGKWYMFGWAFGDLMHDIPTICTPDDHDVFQGNLWGGQGIPKQKESRNTDDRMGFAEPVKMVNAVNRTQCAHLPDPFDPAPIEQGMSVWYTSLNYGRVSFAIVSDRIFKSGPDLVSTWGGRKDHITEPLENPSIIEKPGLEFLGKRQEVFLENWIRDWNNVCMKVLLSQTVFANVATHHGSFDAFLLGDMDSGGWPKSARDRAIGILRKAYVFQVAGDQHVPSLLQYGVNEFRDAGWCYVTPAISVGYSRWFRPDDLNYPVVDRPAHGLPNTGSYTDIFGNKNFVYAIGNPGNFKNVPDRYERAQIKTSGFGVVIFDQKSRDISVESWRFLANIQNPSTDDQHPGWPFTLNQMDNYGQKAVAWLPTLEITGDPDPVVELINQKTKETEYIVRIKGNTLDPKVFSNDLYTVRISYPEKSLVKEFTDIKPAPDARNSVMVLRP